MDGEAFDENTAELVAPNPEKPPDTPKPELELLAAGAAPGVSLGLPKAALDEAAAEKPLKLPPVAAV